MLGHAANRQVSPVQEEALLSINGGIPEAEGQLYLIKGFAVPEQ